MSVSVVCLLLLSSFFLFLKEIGVFSLLLTLLNILTLHTISTYCFFVTLFAFLNIYFLLLFYGYFTFVVWGFLPVG